MTFSGSDSRNGQDGRFWMNTTYIDANCLIDRWSALYRRSSMPA